METELEGFDEFWRIYPRKVAKEAARRMYRKSLKLTTSAEILRGAQQYAAERKEADPKYTKHPATWLNSGCWSDEPAPQGVYRNANSVIAAADRIIDGFGGVEAARGYIPGSSGPQPLRLDSGPVSPSLQRLPSR